MEKVIGFESKKIYFLLGLFSLYYVFIELLLCILFSSNPKELIQQLWHYQWPQYLIFLGFMSGFYLTFSSIVRIAPYLEIYLKTKSYRDVGLTCLELIIQLVWIFLPIELANNAYALSKQNPPIVIGCIVFAVSLATFRRLRTKTIKETMKLIQAF